MWWLSEGLPTGRMLCVMSSCAPQDCLRLSCMSMPGLDPVPALQAWPLLHTLEHTMLSAVAPALKHKMNAHLLLFAGVASPLCIRGRSRQHWLWLWSCACSAFWFCCKLAARPQSSSVPKQAVKQSGQPASSMRMLITGDMLCMLRFWVQVLL